ncbi:hypothetical protein O1611_g1097 [Lasiodiplodia mahajangana]|uniref:Uncharacterized protein n=1 Tax=Lasiodiplodia mahajangana TaxID=1108764 RepID=A0ACC2JYE2_9PEZI|nr:hypothetical protein O1611_g1097 [Lasiodiplodia mahajangana]
MDSAKIWSDLTDLSTAFVDQSHNTLKKCCLTYMKMEVAANFQESTHEVITQRFPFLEYANQELLYHADQAQSHNKRNVRRYTLKVSLLYIFAEANTPALIRAYQPGQSCFKVEDERYGLPILTASATRSGEAIRTMLEPEAERLSNPSLTSLVGQLTSNLEALHAPSRAFTLKKSSALFDQVLEFMNVRISLIFLETERYNVQAKGPNGRTILESAIEKGFKILVTALIQRGADEQMLSPRVISEGPTEMARLRINLGINILATTNSNGETPLHVAFSRNRLRIARLLIDGGAGQTPLYIASFRRHTEMVMLLIDLGADVSAAHINSQTPLYAAFSNGHFEIARLLINRGVEIPAFVEHGANTVIYSLLLGAY